MSDATHSWRQGLSDMRWRVAVFMLSCVLTGVVVGILWAVLAFRPGYVLDERLKATLNERGLAGLFAADALFSLLLGAFGLAIGIACWMLFQRNGWWVCALSVLGASIAAVLAWRVGLLVTPDDFNERLASAVAGDMVPVDLQLRAMASLLVAPFTAITPVMLLAAFAPEPGDASDDGDPGIPSVTVI